MRSSDSRPMMRECGECVVCCVYPRIEDPELKKAPMKHCPNLALPYSEVTDVVYYTGGNGSKNCRIYETKPQSCAYLCAWRQGHGDEDDRPDKSLMLFDNAKGIGNSLQAKPLKDGREETPEGKAIIDRMSRSTGRPVIVLNFYERRIQRIAGGPV